MTKEVQQAGGTSETEDSRVGEPRQITVDTSNQELRLHDGATPGGHKIINRDAGDERWQGRSVELDGFSFPAAGRGGLYRIGPSNYRLRSLTVNTENLKITNPLGILGNPLFELAPIITSAHEWGGIQTHTAAIEAEGGLNGNTNGLHTGNVVGDVTGDLTGDAAGNHTGSFNGDLNTVGQTVVMDTGQIKLEWLEDAILDLWISRGVMLGGIIMWAGDESDIPVGWFLCDGDNGTPDLSDKFVLASGPTSAPHTFGGSATHIHTGTAESAGLHAHLGSGGAPHSLTIAELPSHQHGSGVADNGTAFFNHGSIPAAPNSASNPSTSGGAGTIEGLTSAIGAGDPHSHGNELTDDAGAHTHVLDVDSASNIPPCYVLAFLMKGV